jgi:hypothetical protein
MASTASTSMRSMRSLAAAPTARLKSAPTCKTQAHPFMYARCRGGGGGGAPAAHV